MNSGVDATSTVAVGVLIRRTRATRGIHSHSQPEGFRTATISDVSCEIGTVKCPLTPYHHHAHLALSLPTWSTLARQRLDAPRRGRSPIFRRLIGTSTPLSPFLGRFHTGAWNGRHATVRSATTKGTAPTHTTGPGTRGPTISATKMPRISQPPKKIETNCGNRDHIARHRTPPQRCEMSQGASRWHPACRGADLSGLSDELATDCKFPSIALGIGDVSTHTAPGAPSHRCNQCGSCSKGRVEHRT